MYFHLQIVHLIKMVINLLQDLMIVLVKYGKHKLEIYYILSRVIKMQYILWHLIFHLGTYISDII